MRVNRLQDFACCFTASRTASPDAGVHRRGAKRSCSSASFETRVPVTSTSFHASFFRCASSVKSWGLRKYGLAQKRIVYAVQESIEPQANVSPGVLWQHQKDPNDVSKDGAFTSSGASEKVGATQTASEPLDLKLLLLSGETLVLLSTEQSWTIAKLKAAALEHMQPGMLPQSFICSKGVIHENETLETLSLTTGDSLQVIMHSLVGRYCGKAEAFFWMADVDDVFEVQYELNIAQNNSFKLTASICSRTATLHGKVALRNRFIFDTSQPGVRLWLDDAGLVKLSDTGVWDFFNRTNSVVTYCGVEELLLSRT